MRKYGEAAKCVAADRLLKWLSSRGTLPKVRHCVSAGTPLHGTSKNDKGIEATCLKTWLSSIKLLCMRRKRNSSYSSCEACFDLIQVLESSKAGKAPTPAKTAADEAPAQVSPDPPGAAENASQSNR